jgi:hypothetical protein
MANAQRTEDPHDRLTRIGDRMTDALKADPEHQAGDKAIVMLMNDGDGHGHGGITLAGYDDDTSAMADLLIHLKAIFEANGKKFMIMPAGRG